MLNEYDTSDQLIEPAIPQTLPAAIPPHKAITAVVEPEELPVQQLVHASKLLQLSIIMGFGMVVGAIIWVNLLRGENIWDALQPSDLWLVLPGMALGTIFAWATWFVFRRLKTVHRIIHLLEQTIDFSTIQLHHVILLSILAAIPEELLFRGAAQAQFGLIVASLIFGALHAISRLYFAYATIAGLLLGLLYTLSGTLWLPIGAHFAIDVVMFLLILQRKHHRIR